MGLSQVDLQDASALMEPWAYAAIQDLQMVQQITLPPNYGHLSLPKGATCGRFYIFVCYRLSFTVGF